MQVEDRIPAPHRFTFYNNYVNGKEINTVKLNLMWKEYMKQVCVDSLLEACKSTGCVAIATGYLSRHEKDQHKGKRYRCDNKSFYLFPVDQVPMSIYCKLTPKDGKLIYE